jgi:hypothetical protein
MVTVYGVIELVEIPNNKSQKTKQSLFNRFGIWSFRPSPSREKASKGIFHSYPNFWQG